MKNVFLVLALFFLGNAHAQSYQNEQKLVEYLGQQRFDDLVTKNSNYLNFLDARCSYGYDLIEYVPEKMSDFETVNALQLTNSDKSITTISPEDLVQAIQNGSFNVLRLKLEFDRKSPTYFILGNTGKVLLLYSVERINKKLNQ